MRRRLLVIAMVTTMVASTLLVGCGGSDTSEATTKASVEQNNNNDNKVEDSTKDTSTKEEGTSKEEAKGYDEVFYEEPDWAVEYEGKSEAYIEKKKREYAAMKWVFEDMTQNFKHKKEVTALEPIEVSFSPDEPSTTFVCDINNVLLDNSVNSEGEPIIWEKDLYPEFAGFKVSETSASSWIDDPVISVSLQAPYVGGQTPLYLTAYVTPNEDGTYTYKSISVGSNIYE